MVDMAATFDGQPWETLRRAGKVAVRPPSPPVPAVLVNGIARSGRGTSACDRDGRCYTFSTELSTVVACSTATRYGARSEIGDHRERWDAGLVRPWTSRPRRSSYRHWRLSRRRPGGHPDPAGRSRRRPAGRLRAQAQLLRPGRRHRAGRRRPAPPLRAPRGPRRRAHRRARQGVLRRRQHPDAGRVVAPPQGQLLQVHQRDPQRASRTPPRTPARSGSRPSTAPRPAAATSWRWPATRSCSSTTWPRPSRCPRCRCWPCCPAPVGSPGWSTSATSAGTWPTSSPPAPRAARAARPSSGGWSTLLAPRSRFAEVVRERAADARRRLRPARRRPRRRPRRRSAGCATATTGAPSTSRSAIDRELGAATITVHGPAGPAADG